MEGYTSRLAIGNNAALLPAPMQEKFAKLFDDAPQVSYDTVRKVLRAEFGKEPAGPNGIFEIFEEKAIASASIAQVHRAKLKSPDGDGAWVAVKVQKPAVSKQVEWDLAAYRAVMWLYENYLFDMPVYFVADFITDHLKRELDFELELKNSVQTAKFVASEPRLADKVYIPKVYPEYTTKKVLVAEWIDGVRLSDRASIFRLMGEKDPRRRNTNGTLLSGTDGRPYPFPNKALLGGVSWIMDTMVQLFSAQIFEFGWIHCDPHPGNIIIRPNPRNPRRPQLVLLDHGLYVRVSPTFQRQYATLWKGLVTMDFDVIRDIATQWGIGTPDLFASATLMKPVKFGNDSSSEAFEKMDQYQRSVLIKERLRGFLTDTDKMPKALVFIGRNMRIVQGNNQMFGSPVNRIRITGMWASRSLVWSHQIPFRQRVREYFSYFAYLLIMLTIDASFWYTKLRQRFWSILGRNSANFEDELEKTMRGFAKSNFGVEISDDAFEG
ncbi:hypothetical protein EIP86_011328 [Pleurotus ostreatoroseus]|nr:hypothetical protein EIP86_011328 [Pleurotus ostreatoroseus]